MNLSTKKFAVRSCRRTPKNPLKKFPLFAYNRSMRILRKRLHFGVFLIALCAAASAESKTKAAQAKREALIAEAKKYIGSP